MAKNLSDTARTILAAAAARSDLHLLPLPTMLKAPPVIIRKTVGMLINSGLVAEVPAGAVEPVWEHSEASSPVVLVATAAGLGAIGNDSMITSPAPTSAANPPPVPHAARIAQVDAQETLVAAAPRKKARAARGSTSRQGGASGGQSKQSACIALLRRGNGASLPDLMIATGWQSHSVRGFLSGALKKRLRVDIVSEKDESGERRYHIAVLRTAASQR